MLYGLILMNRRDFPDWSGLQHMIWWNPDSSALSIWHLKTKVSAAKVQCYQWLFVWVNVLACKLDSLKDTMWDYCEERGVQACTNIGRVFMDHTLGLTWITMPEVDHKKMQGHSYPCRKLCRGIRAAGRLVLEGLDAGLLMGEQENRKQAGV